MEIIESSIFQLWLIVFLYRFVNKAWEKILARQLIRDGLMDALLNPTQFPHLQSQIEQRTQIQYSMKLGQYCILPILGFWVCFQFQDFIVVFSITLLTAYNNYTTFR